MNFHWFGIYKWNVFYWIVPMMGHSSTFKLKTRVNALWVKKVIFLVFFFFLYLSICILFYLFYVSFILLFACSSFNTFLFSYVSHFLLFTIQYLNSPFNTFIFKYSMFILFLSLYSFGWKHVHLSDCSFITNQSLTKTVLNSKLILYSHKRVTQIGHNLIQKNYDKIRN